MSEETRSLQEKRRLGATARARTLRQKETEPEYRLWGELRNRLLNGYKFARQIPIGPYYVDFLCRERKLVIEVDGWQHSISDKDQQRTQHLNSCGYSVLRFWNEEVLRERRAVLDTIRPLRGHPLPKGRGGRQDRHRVSSPQRGEGGREAAG